MVENRTVNGFSLCSLNNINYESTVDFDGNDVIDRIICDYMDLENSCQIDKNLLRIMGGNAECWLKRVN